MTDGQPSPCRVLPRRRSSFVIPSFVILCILAGGAWLRFRALGEKSLWLDEAATMNGVAGSVGQVFLAVNAHDAHPPLYYCALNLWMRGSRSATRARAFSATVSVATLAVFYGLARVLLPVTGALAATLVLAVSAFQVYYAQEVRHYALAAFFVTLSWYFMAQLVAGKRLARWPFWLGLALSNAAALYTFYYALFSVAAQLLLLVLLIRSVGRRLLVPWLAWQLVPASLFAICVPVILERMARLRGLPPPALYTVLSVRGLTETAAQFACGFLGRLVGEARAPVTQAAAAGLSLAVLALVAVFAVRPSGRRVPPEVRQVRGAAAVGLAWLLGPAVLLALLPIRGHTYEPKHLIFASPALALLLGIGLAAARGWRLKPLPLAVLALWLGGNAWSLARYFDPRVEKEDWRDAVAQMAQRLEPNDVVVLNPFYVELPFRYYYDPARLGALYRPHLEVTAPLPRERLYADYFQIGRGRRLWLLEARSNVAIPNDELGEFFRPYPLLFDEPYEGLVGTLRVRLYDTRRALAPDAAAERKGNEAEAIDLQEGLIAHYPLDKDASDASGQGHHAASHGAKPVAEGKLGGAFSFDGLHDYVAIPAEATQGLAWFTISLWVNTTQSEAKPRTAFWQNPNIAGVATAGSGSRDFGLMMEKGHVAYYHGLRPDPSDMACFSTVSVSDGRWHQVAFVNEGARVLLYVDGALTRGEGLWQRSDGTVRLLGVVEQTASGASMGSVELFVGACNDPPAAKYHYRGLIDDVKIWSRALSPQEIAAIWTQAPGPPKP